MHAHRNYSLLVLLALACALLQNPALAKKKAAAPRKPAAACVAKGTCVSSIKFMDSGESRSERAKRLKRECKGRPNAGACLGYAY